MKKIYFIAAIALAACNMPNKEKETEQKATVQQYELLEKWESDSLLKVPESVLFDKANQILYVSNVDGTDPWKADGKGSINEVFMSKSGQIIIDPALWRAKEKSGENDFWTFNVNLNIAYRERFTKFYDLKNLFLSHFDLLLETKVKH